MKIHRLSALLVLATVICGLLVPTTSEAARRRQTRRRVDPVAANIAALATDLAKLNQMRADARKPRSNVIVLGKATPIAETPDTYIRKAIIHFDLVSQFSKNPQMAAAARRGKAAMESGRLDEANAALAKIKGSKGSKKSGKKGGRRRRK